MYPIRSIRTDPALTGPLLFQLSPCAAADAGDAHGDRDHLFVHLLCAYRSHGGLARRDEVARRTQDRAMPSPWPVFPTLHVQWQGSLWLPLFQFETGGTRLRPSCQPLLLEIAQLPDWRPALWFVEPNACLDGARPLDLLETDIARVHRAARMARDVATGALAKRWPGASG